MIDGRNADSGITHPIRGETAFLIRSSPSALSDIIRGAIIPDFQVDIRDGLAPAHNL
jgi:hypothetical protein